MTDPARAPRVSFVSLGCPKALVDSERIITRLRAEGYELARAHAGADLDLVEIAYFGRDLDRAALVALLQLDEALGLIDGSDSRGDRLCFFDSHGLGLCSGGAASERSACAQRQQ